MNLYREYGALQEPMAECEVSGKIKVEGGVSESCPDQVVNSPETSNSQVNVQYGC